MSDLAIVKVGIIGGGLMGKLVILVMPGSRAAVELAMRRIILPELAHIVHEARKA